MMTLDTNVSAIIESPICLTHSYKELNLIWMSCLFLSPSCSSFPSSSPWRRRFRMPRMNMSNTGRSWSRLRTSWPENSNSSMSTQNPHYQNLGIIQNADVGF